MQEGSSDPIFPKHNDGTRFYNPDSPQARGLLDVLRWKLTSRPEPSPAFISDVVRSIPPGRIDGDGLRITLVNHSTVLLQHRDFHILMDPIWSDRASPFSWVGPWRRRPAGVLMEDLPRIDVVLLSHNHYDHLDLATLRILSARGACTFVVPLGVARLLRAEKIGPVHELDWGQSQSLLDFTVHSVPALHFSSRGIFDRNKTLWCGYVIEFRDRRVYFAGDTGFGGHFAQIREKHGTPSLALLPIGAYQPRWFMSPIHMDPQEAVRAHGILGATTSIAIHHGTFQLADEGIDTAKKELIACRGDESFLILNNGEFADLP
jgi:L-ascorbate metabolism protein UlaG (beta-lactamase superfamily)